MTSQLQSPNPELDARYGSALASLPDGERLFASARIAEDEYQRLTSDLIRRSGGSEDIVALYRHAFAFCGGAEANDAALLRLCASMREAAKSIRIDPPAIQARWWPEAVPSAASALGRGGLLIRMNSGLLTQLRFLLHLICGNASPDDGSEFHRMMAECLGNTPAPLAWTVRVHHGAIENARRRAMMAGMTYVLAHELGHHVGRGREFSEAAIGSDIALPEGQPYSEPQAVAAFASEVEADMTACRILLAWAPQFTIEPIDLFLGTAAVLAIQATLFWQEAASPSADLAWTHPFPDLRTAHVRLGLLQPESLKQAQAPHPRDPGGAIDSAPATIDPRSEAIMARLDQTTGVPKSREAALSRGLDQTGLSPLQRAAIAIAYGV